MAAGLIIVGDTRSSRLTSLIISTLADSTVSATVIIVPDNYVAYTSVFDNVELDMEPEQIENKKIVSYAVVWSLISYAVALRKSIEQRSRAPPNVLLGCRRHPAYDLPKLVPIALQ